MKKLLIAMVAILALAFAAPAFAADEGPGYNVVVGGRLWTDFGYQYTSKELGLTSSGKDITTAFLNLNGNTYLNAKFMSADKSTGAHIELSISSTTGNTSSVGLRYAYGWWKVGVCKFVAGHTDSWVGSLAFAPRNYLGTTQSAKILLINWGFLYSGRRTQIRFEMEPSKMFGFSVGLVAPESEMTTPSYNTGWTVYDKYFNFPALEAALSLNFGPVLMMPGFGVSQGNFEFGSASPQKGYDDSYTAWIFQFPIKFQAGIFSLKYQIYYGINSDTSWGGEALPTAAARGKTLTALPLWTASGKVEDTTVLGTSLECAFQFNQLVGLNFGGGYISYNNDKLKETLGYANNDQSRYALFIAVPFQITKNFDLGPEFVWYDYGKSPSTNADYNNEWLLGVTFRFIF